MKGLKAAAKKTKGINYSTRIPLYYNPQNDTVYTTAGENRRFLTYLIRENTPEEIESTVKRFMNL